MESVDKAFRLATAVNSVSNAICKMMTATSVEFGADCHLHAALGKVLLLEEFGIETELKVGHAAWRVGSGDGDVISHVPVNGNEVFSKEKRAGYYHAWLETPAAGVRNIIDLTTYQFQLKARALDSQDGGITHVAWKPEYLILPVSRVRSYSEVANFGVGLCYYEAIPGLAEAVGNSVTVDMSTIAVARTILHMKDVPVLGPRTIPNSVSLGAYV